MNLAIKLDLHTHSITSYDGGISQIEYAQFLKTNPDFVIAITDHNEIGLALELQQEFGSRVIVGEEILSKEGEIIGLFLRKRIAPGKTASETIDAIHQDGGLVYVPHPFEKTRKGLSKKAVQELLPKIDIIEAYNSRSKEVLLSKRIIQFAVDHNLATVASSDAHGIKGLCTGFTEIASIPTAKTLLELVKTGKMHKKHQSVVASLDPLKNKIKKFLWQK